MIRHTETSFAHTTSTVIYYNKVITIIKTFQMESDEIVTLCKVMQSNALYPVLCRKHIGSNITQDNYACVVKAFSTGRHPSERKSLSQCCLDDGSLFATLTHPQTNLDSTTRPISATQTIAVSMRMTTGSDIPNGLSLI